MLRENGLKLLLEELRTALNRPQNSDCVEKLYAYNVEGARRWKNLVSYLNFMYHEQPDTLLIGEAPGYRGTGISGVPFLSEGMIKHRRLQNLLLPFTDYIKSPGYNQNSGYEATSTVMWHVLDTHTAIKLPLLWAVFPNHPHDTEAVLTNRKPSNKEITEYHDITRILSTMYNIKHIVTIGNVAYDTMTKTTDCPVIKLRHPARGGAKKFSEGFSKFVEMTYGSGK